MKINEYDQMDDELTKRNEEKASQKQLEKYAVQPDSRGVFQALVKENEAQRLGNKIIEPLVKSEDIDRLAKVYPKNDEKLFENIIDDLGKPKQKPKTKPYYLNNLATGELENVNAADWKPKKNKDGYLVEATPKMVGELAERLEKSRQMSGSDGRYDKPMTHREVSRKVFKDKRSFEPKKKIPIAAAAPVPMSTYSQYEPLPQIIIDPETERLAANFRKLVRENEDEKERNKYAGLAGLMGEEWKININLNIQ